MAGKVFEATGVSRGRAYPMSKKDKQDKLDFLQTQRWFNDIEDPERKKELIPDFTGWLKVDEDTLSGWLTASQMAGGPIQVFLDLKKIAGDDNGLKQINITSRVSTKEKDPAPKKEDDFPGWDDDLDF